MTGKVILTGIETVTVSAGRVVAAVTVVLMALLEISCYLFQDE